MSDWHLLTGEYPPQPGGVADYTAQLAAVLAASGDTVHVWFPETGSAPAPSGVVLHPLPGRFGPAALALLEAGLGRSTRPRVLLVQYVPHAFGWRAMNLLFSLWLYRQRRHERVWVMFHEVIFPMARSQALRHNVLGGITHLMAALVARAAERCFVSIPAWIPLLQRLSGRQRDIQWLPVPSNLPAVAEPEAVAAARARYAPREYQQLIGHFGTHGGLIAPLVAMALPRVLAPDARRIGLLIGRGGTAVRDQLAAQHPNLAGRLYATGELSPADVVAHLNACDLLLQPYPDGVSCRRTSAMAGLALGVPIATTIGFLTETLWESGAFAALVPAGNAAALAAACEPLLGDSGARRDLGRRGRAMYEQSFGIDRLVHTLRAAAASNANLL